MIFVKLIGRWLVESVIVYCSELWVEDKNQENRLQALKMDCLRRSARKSKLERVPSEEIRRVMQAEETALHRIEARKLRWFGQVMRIPEKRWPAISWIPPGRRKMGRPRWSWRDSITEEDEGRRRPGPDTLEERIGKAADSHISPYIT
jgi:hypothetical protein